MAERTTGPAEDAFETLDRELAELIRLPDPAATLERVARLIPEAVGSDASLVSVVRDDEDVLEIRHQAGTRTTAMLGLRVPFGWGLGGKAAVLRAPTDVEDYVNASTITHQFDGPVSTEGLHGLLAVPIVCGHGLHGILYACMRQPTEFGDRMRDNLLRLARDTALVLDVQEQTAGMIDVAVHDERRRLALSLHDSVGQTLFGIGAAARELRASVAEDDSLSTRITFIEEQIGTATALLRQSLWALSESPPELSVAVALRGDCRAFEERTGVRARVVVIGDLPELDDSRAKTLLLAAREALLNVEKHARATTVIVSLHHTGEGTAVTVADDGVGLSDAPDDHQGLGLEGARERLARIGGHLTLTGNEDGGVTLRAWVPTP
jgi:signal transduction histidine kinase